MSQVDSYISISLLYFLFSLCKTLSSLLIPSWNLAPSPLHSPFFSSSFPPICESNPPSYSCLTSNIFSRASSLPPFLSTSNRSLLLLPSSSPSLPFFLSHVVSPPHFLPTHTSHLLHFPSSPSFTNFFLTLHPPPLPLPRTLSYLLLQPDLVQCKIFEFDHLIAKAKLGEDENFQDFLNPVTKIEVCTK